MVLSRMRTVSTDLPRNDDACKGTVHERRRRRDAQTHIRADQNARRQAAPALVTDALTSFMRRCRRLNTLILNPSETRCVLLVGSMEPESKNKKKRGGCACRTKDHHYAWNCCCGFLGSISNAIASGILICCILLLCAFAFAPMLLPYVVYPGMLASRASREAEFEAIGPYRPLTIRMPGLTGDGQYAYLLTPSGLSALSSRKLVVAFGGNAMSGRHTAAWLLEHETKERAACAAARVDFLFLDYPGYGKSGGTPDQHSITAAAVAAASRATDLYDYEAVRVIGVSLGAAVALSYAAHVCDPDFYGSRLGGENHSVSYGYEGHSAARLCPTAGIELVSPFTSVHEVAVTQLTPSWFSEDPPARPMEPGLIAGLVRPWLWNNYDSLRRLLSDPANCKLPLIFTADSEDGLTPPWMSSNLQKHARVWFADGVKSEHMRGIGHVPFDTSRFLQRACGLARVDA